MGIFYTTSVCCMILSVWAIIQLAIMGMFYNMEATPLLEDVEAEKYEHYNDFLVKTKRNYHLVAINCWIVSGMYAGMLIISCGCWYLAKRMDRKKALRNNDDEYFCNPALPKKEKNVTQPAKKSEKKKEI